MPCLPKDPGNIAANGRNPANHLGCFWNEHSWINYKPQLVQEFYHPQLKKILMLLHVFLHKILSLSIFQALPFGPKKASLPILWQHPTSTLPCRLCRAWRPCQPCRLCLLCQGWASQKIDFFAPLNPSSWTDLAKAFAFEWLNGLWFGIQQYYPICSVYIHNMWLKILLCVYIYIHAHVYVIYR